MEDFMPLDVPKPQIKKTNAKAAKKHDILPPIENADNLTHADSSIEGLSEEEGDENDEKAMSRGRIISPSQKSKTIGSENRDISDDKNSGTSSSKEAEMDHETEKFDTEVQEEPDVVNNDEEEGEEGKYDDGVQDEANNIEDIDANDGDEQVNTQNMRNQEEWGKEVHEDD